MPKYIITSNYYEYETNMRSALREAETLLEAIILDCMDRCHLKDHEACVSLETESFQVCVWELVEKGDPVSCDWRTIGWPWHAQQVLSSRIDDLEEAMKTAESMSVLSTIPGTNAGALNLEPVHAELVVLKEQRQRSVDAWTRRKEAPVQDNRERIVDVDAPNEDKHVTTD